MKIVTFIKQVPSSAATPRIAAGKDRIDERSECDLSYEVNETDLYAIEEALHQRSTHNGAVTVVTIGPGRAREALGVAYAKGVDQAVHIVDDGARGSSSLSSVAAAAALLKTQEYDIIFAGIQADDDLHGRFGIALAEALDIPVVSAVTQITVDLGKRIATVTRELGGGFKEEIEVDLPCLLTIQFGIRPVRYTSVMSIVRARTRKIETINIDALVGSPEELQANDHLRVVELSYPEDGGRCELIEGEPAVAAKTLVRTLIDNGII